MRVSVFGGSTALPGEPLYETARALGAGLADAGYTVATGGYGGTMEATSRGAAEAGGHVVGITAPSLFPNRPGANQWVGEERQHTTLLNRINDLVENSEAAVVLPGSIGTFAELVAFWNHSYIARFSGTPERPLVAIGSPWDSLVPELALRLQTDGDLVTLVPDVPATLGVLRVRLGS